MKKLILSADESVIEQAEKIAREHGTSVSAMFERYIRALARQGENAEVPADSIAARVTGLAKLPPGRTDRDLLDEALMEKYGIEE